MSLTDFNPQHRGNPLEVVERVASLNDWSFERAGEDEITILVRGKWTDYQVSFTWMYDIEALHLACAFELKVPQARRNEMIELVARVNEQLWIGHFEMWASRGLVLFRHAALLESDNEGTLSLDQAETLVEAAIDECERFYPVFQFVLWADKSPAEALAAALIETQGEA